MTRHAPSALLSIALGLACATSASAGDPPSLLETIAPWRYPGSDLKGAQGSDGATVDTLGNRTVPSTISKTTMTTDAPVVEVLDYYRGRLTPDPKPKGGRAEPADQVGRSSSFSDDSDGRDFELHTVIVNAGDVSTTLVISRGKGESKTHIAWKQYRRFAP